ncbi:dihydrolipoyl dehydrogenase [Nocardiopsis chromatogenes]|uniref:dihydrolipoyl dehydrogenase n=1 Tax=Nocardiopsis chromatogenes TaxID=280239 RepID=UPI000347AF27|nr:dihydrolipoyl dehydrogenase [Nocardiopsis chromatogenes]
MAQHFDVVVLGAGPGGYVAAIRAAQLGLKTAVVEEKYWGGVCLNVGCIPSKALLRNAELAYTLSREADTFGIEFGGKVSFDYGKAYRRSRDVADGRVKGVHFLMKKNKITELNGRGTFTGPTALEVSGPDGTEQVTFDNAIIAAGASPRLLPGTSLSDRVVTYEEQILADEVPASIIIAGAGAIGLEFAYVLRNYGVEVTLVEFLDRIAPTEDEEVSAELARHFKRLGVEVLTSTRVDTVEESGGKVRAAVTGPDGAQKTLEADKLLQAIGFAPNTGGYGLEAAGVELTDRGAVAVDARGRTNVPGVYAIGDVTAKLMLAHTAEAMGIIAAETIAGAETQEIDFRMIPRATYCQPQVASFGYTEAQAREAGFDVQVAKFPIMANGKAHGLGDTRGFVKVLADGRYGELLGAHMIGPEVTELLPELTLAQQWDLTVHEVSRNVHAHPSLSEAVKEAVHGLAGHMINL